MVGFPLADCPVTYSPRGLLCNAPTLNRDRLFPGYDQVVAHAEKQVECELPAFVDNGPSRDPRRLSDGLTLKPIRLQWDACRAAARIRSQLR
jgi:hypothetical protein